MMVPRRFAWMLALALVCGLGPVAQAANDPAQALTGFNQQLVDVAQQCRAATVGIVIPGGSMGSGVIINEQGLVLTAAHVLPEAGGDIIIVLADGTQLPGKALGVNRQVDSGMAQITEPGKYPLANVADADTIWEGDWCIAFGNGGGVQTDRPAPMRLGRILHVSSATSNIRWITTDSTVISGDSGGPLFDLQGNVIGIHSNIGMSVLVNRHVPISAYHAQWKALLEPTEVNELPPAAEPLIPGLGEIPDGIEREIARRLADGDQALRDALESKRDEAGNIELTPEEIASLIGRDDVVQEILAYQEKLESRRRTTDQIENADNDVPELEESDVSRQSTRTRLLIMEKKRERMLDDLAQDMRKKHGKIADHVLSRFEPAVSASGANTVQVLCRGRVVALGTIIRQDGYIVTKASELLGPARVRIGEDEYAARVVNGNGPNDLALLKIDAQGLATIQWAADTPALGSLLVVPNPAGKPLAMGVVGVDARPIPQSINNVYIPPPPAPFLGIGDLVTPESEDGVKVGSIVEDAPAAAAGLQADDIITAIDGQAIDGVEALIEIIQQAQVDDEVALTIRRGEETIELTVKLGARPVEERPEPQGDDSRSAAQVYSARGGDLSDRRTNFPLALTHDAVIWATDIGGPVLNLNGQAIGINIARYGRTATYALPAEHAKQAIAQMMRGK